MNVFTMVFLIVTVALCAGVIKTWLEQRKGRDETSGEIGQMLSRLDALQDRIEVLERIVTDDRVGLKRKIDSL
jgi:site-specific recombinase